LRSLRLSSSAAASAALGHPRSKTSRVAALPARGRSPVALTVFIFSAATLEARDIKSGTDWSTASNSGSALFTVDN